MTLLDLLQTAASSMLRSKARTFLTIIAIFIGAMTITLTNGIGSGIKSYLNKQIGNLGATNVLQIQLTNSASGQGLASSKPASYNPNQKISTAGGRVAGDQQLLMSSKDLSTIKSIPHITNAAAERAISPDYIMGTGTKYQLTLQEQFGTTTAQMRAGSGVNNNSQQNQITVPESYVGVLGYSSDKDIIGKPVTIGITSAAGKQTTVTATVVGIQQKTLIGAAVAFVNAPLTRVLYAAQSAGLPAATADSFSTVEATFPQSFTPAQVTNLKNTLKAKGYTGQTIKDQENTIFTAINAAIIVFDIFGGIALLAASFGIINTLYMSVQERTKEIGLMKALGMSSRQVFLLFSIEAVLIGFWGSAFGVAFAFLLGNIIDIIAKHAFLKSFPGLSLLTFPWSTIVIVIVLIMVIAFLAGTLPALRASKKNPIEALRYE